MEILKKTDTYITQQARPFNCCNTLIFYLKLLKIVFKAASVAKKGLYDDQEWIKNSIQVLQALESVGCKFEISGRNNFFQLDTPCVFVANHMSTLETFVLPCLIHPFKKITFVVKESLLNYPVFKYVMRSREPIAVTRTNAREDFRRVMVQGVKKIEQGYSIVVFPQTTRTNYFAEQQFNSIGVKLAKKAGVPVVPVALKTNAWSNGKLIKDFGPIHPEKKIYFQFGPPISAQEIVKNPKQAHQRTVAFIKECLSQWQAD
ncbi:MAG: lysophospholipid acyltransferase family protein [Desulfonauticus sp.]|nr:lysophospholipid acyltransferase family protein [Desulfonauticus sp.]